MGPKRLAAAFRRAVELWPLLPAALYLSGFLILVASYLLWLSFSTAERGGDDFPTLATAAKVLGRKEVKTALFNTILFTLVGTPLELAVGIFFALIVYCSFPLRNVVRSIFLIPLAVPALVTAILLFILFDYPGGHVNHLLLGNYPAFPALLTQPINWRGSKVFALGISLLGKVWRDMPISMLIILAGLLAIDPELLDAARTMGAGWRRQFRHVILPLIVPSMSAVVLLRSIEMWKEFIFPFVLAGQHHLLGTLIESLYNDWGASHEASFVALVLVGGIVMTVLFFLFGVEMFRRFTSETGRQ